MWKLRQRNDNPAPKTSHDLGDFASICDATGRVNAAEEDRTPDGDAIFFPGLLLAR